MEVVENVDGEEKTKEETDTINQRKRGKRNGKNVGKVENMKYLRKLGKSETDMIRNK